MLINSFYNNLIHAFRVCIQTAWVGLMGYKMLKIQRPWRKFPNLNDGEMTGI